VKLKKYRAMANLTQKQLAERLEVSELSIIKYEGGITMPSREAMLTIYKITDGLVTPNDFFDLEAIPQNGDFNSGNATFVAAGLMSGTSMDGIDSSLIITDGEKFVKELGSHSIEYESEFKLLMKGCEWAAWESEGDLQKSKRGYLTSLKRYLCKSQSISTKAAEKLFDDLCFYFHGKTGQTISFDQVVQKSTDLHIEVLKGLLKKTGYKPKNVDIVGYHGQTIFHRPASGITLQVGDGQRLADEVGIAVTYDFRSNDVKHGGQGAPFAPLYHKAISNQIGLTPVVIANCGGISNITVIGTNDEELYSFDCGPGNSLVDRFVQLKIGKKMDKDGLYGSKGKIVAKVLKQLQEKALIMPDGSNYLERKPPKSLDVNDLMLIAPAQDLDLQNGCATLEAFTVDCIVGSLDSLPIAIPKLWVLAGGGWNNKVIKDGLEERLKQKLGLDIRVQNADDVGWSGQAMEAQIFAYLAVRSLKKLPLSLPGTTGVRKPLTGGRIVTPKSDLKKTTKSVRLLLKT
jgi:anhydro-N-acetylmuramic acid kinase